MLTKIRQSEFVRSVIVLMTGTVIAQAVAYLVYPILTRLFTPDEMAEQGLYLRIVLFISAIATARYELTLPIARQDLHAFHLYRLSFRIALVVITVATLVCGIYSLFHPLAGQNNVLFLVLTILSAYLTVCINLGTNWAIRMKEFRHISRQRVINAVVSNVLRCAFGFFSWGGMGLIFASFLGTLSSSFVFVSNFLRLRKQHSNYRSKGRMRVIGKEYRQFPLLNLPHALLDFGVDLALASFIMLYFGDKEFGLYGHAFLILKLPLAVMGQSIGQVFLNKCSDMVNKGMSVVPLVKKTFRTLFLLSVVPFTLLFFFGEPLFGFVFGKAWSTAGTYASIMAPWLMLNFMLSPVSGMPQVLGRQKEVLIIGMCSAFGQLTIFGFLPQVLPQEYVDMETLLWATTIYHLVLLGSVFPLYLYFAKTGRKQR